MNPTTNAECGMRNAESKIGSSIPHSAFHIPHSEDSAFRNEPHSDFSREENRSAMQTALREVATQFDRRYALVIDGREIDPGQWLESVDPSNLQRMLGKFALARKEDATAAIDAAARAEPNLREQP